MSHILEIIQMGLITIVSVILNPIFWVAIGLVYFQYNKISKMEKKILGSNKKPTGKRVLSSTVTGIWAGILGSVFIIALGIVISPGDFKYILLLAVLLMMIHPRFICFSYSGGILSLSSLIFGMPNINVSSLMAIVAILHMVESFLILVDGASSKIPVFLERDDKVVGGFNMMRFWPIPLIVLLLSSSIPASGGVAMPDWWPLFYTGEVVNKNDLSFLMIGVIAALGYGDIAITDYPENKIKYSAKNLFFFSITLLVLSITSLYVFEIKYVAALFSPIAHELLIQYGRKKEKKGEPIFVPPTRGVKILDVIPEGVGQEMGLKTGDIIYAVNGKTVDTKEDIGGILMSIPSYVWVDYFDKNRETHTKDIRDYRNGIRSLDILVIPRDSQYKFTVKNKQGLMIRIINKIKKRIKS